MKFAYADPPYLGCGQKLYGKHHPDAGIWDDPETHRQLIIRLCDEYPDGWALSLHQPSLRVILPMTPTDCRIGAYCKAFAQIRNNCGVQWFWEPVIFRGGRKDKMDELRRDWVIGNSSASIAQGGGLVGQKPRDFSRWVFSLLGAIQGDTLDDLFPGSMAVSAAWAEWVGEQSPLPQLPLYEWSPAP